ncbi:hypothetical protein PMAYCL1PPCAC_18610, partial [Pristionchus mayeri]
WQSPMFSTLYSIYYYSFFFVYSSTILLVLCRSGWGPIPRWFLSILDVINGRKEEEEGPILFEKKSLISSVIENGKEKEGEKLFAVSLSLAGNGIASIIRDDMMLGMVHPPSTLDLLTSKSRHLSTQILHYIGLLFRLGFLFPLRVLFMASGLLFAIGSSFIVLLYPGVTRETLLYFTITFGRLFNVTIGLVPQVHNKKHRPKYSGIAVANHLTANDIMTIYCECDEIGYTITGQKHGGFIYPLELLGDKLSPTLWLDRSCYKDRAAFQKLVLDYASQPSTYPVLMFPEGFCSNNQTVLQFRKGVFGGDVPFYPIALKQQTRFGDSFWLENTYLPYLLRCMISWALVVRITYLPQMRREENESSEDFAKRVQNAIANYLERPASPYDGSMKRPADRLLYSQKLKSSIARVFDAQIDSSE